MASMGNDWISGSDWLAKIAEQLKDTRGASDPLTVRQFLAKFGNERRGRNVVARLRDELARYGLRTEPDFEYEYIDADLVIRSATQSAADSTLRMGSFKVARGGVTSVKPTDPLCKATTLMQLNQFSQLPVMTSKHTVKGMVSWESIGRCVALGEKHDLVSDCMVAAQVISIQKPLLEAVRTIAEHGYVLVKNETKEISGIVAASDLSEQFMDLAEPFLLVGQIERHLRQIIQFGKFSDDELTAMCGTEEGRNIQNVDDLTFGGYCTILSNPDAWNRLAINVHRHEFVRVLEAVRETRNNVMHFNPGDNSDDTKTLRKVAAFLDRMAGKGK